MQQKEKYQQQAAQKLAEFEKKSRPISKKRQQLPKRPGPE